MTNKLRDYQNGEQGIQIRQISNLEMVAKKELLKQVLLELIIRYLQLLHTTRPI